ncbi:hypothetical protein N7519_004255 [Penicillium mononematosum]|uniref:uncharacterized protein n=1 Tax=Penicillium mononematosum TaxID=268346 RepID=UPI00254977D7|nr:uncharacterized protein N7519_004255 [Penicillium mononematosum]KAJ6189347.1 hypothetical protein N7519_004255 [Penicillium mononematosum]
MSRKNIFLVGAPLSANLNWDTDELLNKPIPPFHDNTSSPEQLSLEQPPVRWRVLRSSVDKLGDNYDSFQGYEDPAFFISHQLAVAADATDATQEQSEDSILQFYDHSFAIHETSEVAGSDLYVTDSIQDSSLGEDSMLASFTRLDKPDTPRSPRILHIPESLSNLQDLPTASEYDRGGVGSSSPRRIVTRQWKTELDLIELVVGDETRAGFAVNFWLKPEKQTAAKNNEADRLRRSLASIRPRDIVLLRTVGLSTFQDRVYGQSLRRG